MKALYYTYLLILWIALQRICFSRLPTIHPEWSCIITYIPNILY